MAAFAWATRISKASTGWFLLALGSTFTSVSSCAPEQPPPSLEVAPEVLEAELGLARTPALYLVVEAHRGLLLTRARGMTLAEVPLQSVVLLRASLASGEEKSRGFLLWEVQESVMEYRRPEIQPQAVEKALEESLSRPAIYTVRLDQGWELRIGQRLPYSRWWERAWLRGCTGWGRLIGRPVALRDVVGIALEAGDARKLVHLFQPGLKILWVNPSRPRQADAAASSAPAAGAALAPSA